MITARQTSPTYNSVAVVCMHIIEKNTTCNQPLKWNKLMKIKNYSLTFFSLQNCIVNVGECTFYIEDIFLSAAADDDDDGKYLELMLNILLCTKAKPPELSLVGINDI